MKNMSFIAFMMSHTKEETINFLAKKEAMDLPNDLSKKAKFLIGQSGKKKEDVFRETGLSRDYLYKVLRGTKRVKERDYILAVCLAANLDLVDTHIMLEMYNLPALRLDSERDILIIHALNEKLGLKNVNKILLEAGYHAIRVSPQSDINNISPIHFADIKLEKVNIEFDKAHNSIDVSAAGYVENDLIFGYAFHDDKAALTCNQNSDHAKVYQYLFNGIIWQKVAELMDTIQAKDDTTMIQSIASNNGIRVIAEAKRGAKYYQVVRFADGHMIYSASLQGAFPYLCLQNTNDLIIYNTIYGYGFIPTFDIYGGDLEELENAEDIDVAVFLRMRREISKWRIENREKTKEENTDMRKFA